MRHLLATVVILLGLSSGTDADMPPTEHQLKTVFLYNFARFARWPAEGDSTEPLRICIIGQAPFADAFDAITGRLVRKRRIVLQRHASLAAVADCHLLFVTATDRRRVDDILKKVAGKPVMTVGEGVDFVRQGGMLSFIIRGKKVCFVANPAAAQKVGIHLSSRLLRIAESYRVED